MTSDFDDNETTTSSRGRRSEEIARTLRHLFLTRLVRPARKVNDAGLVVATERQLDLLIALAYREILGAAGLKSRTMPTRFGMVHYYDSAPGSHEKPLVLLHGLGSSGQCFGLLAAMLRGKRRVVCPDLFHFGGFSQANNPVMTLPDHVESMAEFLEGLASGPVDFCGLSLGGWVALRLAIGRPDLMSKLLLLNPAGVKFRVYQLRDMLAYVSWQKFHSLYPGILRAFPYTGMPLLSDLLKRSLFRVLKDDSVRDFIKTVRGEDFVDAEVSRITCPTLLLWGREDRFLSPKIPVFLASKVPGIEAWYVDRCAHILCLEAPGNVYYAFTKFLGLEPGTTQPLARVLLGASPSYPMVRIAVDDESGSFPLGRL